MTAGRRAILALAAAVAFGAALGVAADRWWLARAAEPSAEASFVQMLDDAVDLDSIQTRRARAIVDRHQLAVDSAWKAVRPDVHVAIMAAQSEIAAILRPEQRARYDAWVASMHASMRDSMQ